MGVTLVELMIAGVIGLIALASILTVYGTTTKQNHLQLETAHLHQQVHGMLHLMSRDIRRSGFWSFDAQSQHAFANPFQKPPNQLRVSAHPGEAPGSCLLLAYDLDSDGLVGIGKCPRGQCSTNTDDDNVEQFGYRLRSGSLQSRYGGSKFSCDSGFWQALSDPAVEVTQLQFTPNRNCLNLTDKTRACDGRSTQLIQQAIQIDVSAQVVKKPRTTVSFSQWVRARNDSLEVNTP